MTEYRSYAVSPRGRRPLGTFDNLDDALWEKPFAGGFEHVEVDVYTDGGHRHHLVYCGGGDCPVGDHSAPEERPE